MASDLGGINEGLKSTTSGFNNMIDTIQGIEFWIDQSLQQFFNGLAYFTHLFGG